MSTPSYTDASAPFDSSAPKADIILRSSDNIDFYFSKNLLIYSSPFFENLFSDGVPDEIDGTDVDGRPVITLPDHSTDLRRFLSIIHPLHETDPLWSVEEVISLHAILDKYCIDDVEGIIYRIALASPLVVDKTPPVILYIVSVHLQHAPLAQLAAKAALRIPARELLGNAAHEQALDMYNPPARYLNQLVRYHRECSTAAAAAFAPMLPEYGFKTCEISWMSYESQRLVAQSSSRSGVANVVNLSARYRLSNDPSEEVTCYIDPGTSAFVDAVYAVLKTRPCVDAVRTLHSEIDVMGKCLISPSYSKVNVTQVMRLVREACVEVDRRLAQVKFKITF